VQIRCRNIADAIQRTGFHSARLLDIVSFVQNTREAQEICQNSDILVVHKHLYGAVVKSLMQWKAHGKKIMADVDEPVHLIDPDMPAYNYWKKGIPENEAVSQIIFNETPIRPAPLDQFSWGLKILDAITVPSVRLADDFSASVRAIYLPDYINSDQYMIQRTLNDGRIHIGVSGNCVNFKNLVRCGLLAALENVCRQREKVVIHFFELDPVSIESSQIPAKMRIIHDDIPAFRWPSFLANLDIGITFAEGNYSSRSSKLRIIEYSTMKIPWLASDLLPFRKMENFGRLVTNTPEHWSRAILEIIDHLDTYQAEANGEPFLYGISQDVYENVDKIIAIYESVLNPPR
jgi:hypothetical protein